MQLLLVDDEPLILKAISRAIEIDMPDWRIDTAENGLQALERMEGKSYDCVITDVQMPKMSGVELLQNVKARFPEIIRVILSGQADNNVAMRAVKPMHRFLAKPCRTDELIKIVDRTVSLYNKCRSPELKKAVGGIGNLPSLPELYQKVQEAVNDPAGDSSRVGAVIKTDPAISAKLLQIVNSALFAIPRKVNSIEQAISILGFSMIQNLVLTTKIMSSFQKEVPGFSAQSVFDHSLRVAKNARIISRAERLSRPEAEGIFTAALLHDIGKLVLADRMADEYSSILKSAQPSSVPFHELEKESLGCHHAEVGGALLQLWGLPDELVEAVVFHHDPAIYDLANSTSLNNIVFASNAIDRLREGSSTAALGLDGLPLRTKDAIDTQLQQWRRVVEIAERDE